jgi:hypothetical protein
MRNYYASDKKRREDAKRKKQEEKRLAKLKRNSSDSVQTKTDSDPTVADPEEPVN